MAGMTSVRGLGESDDRDIDHEAWSAAVKEHQGSLLAPLFVLLSQSLCGSVVEE